jgi:hypothetical protein
VETQIHSSNVPPPSVNAATTGTTRPFVPDPPNPPNATARCPETNRRPAAWPVPLASAQRMIMWSQVKTSEHVKKREEDVRKKMSERRVHK